MFQRLIIAIAVCVSAAIVVSIGVRQLHRSMEPPEIATPTDSSQEIRSSLERIALEAERLAIGPILDDLQKKSYLEILALRLAPNVCQEIACRAVPPETARRYVEAYAAERVVEDAHQTALRNAAAAERSAFFAAGAAIISLLSLSISALSYRRTLRSPKGALPA
jgi:hypothetical protein